MTQETHASDLEPFLVLEGAAEFLSLESDTLLAEAKRRAAAGQFRKAGKNRSWTVFPPEPGRSAAEMAAAAVFDEFLSPWGDAVSKAVVFEAAAGGAEWPDEWAGIFLGWGGGGAAALTVMDGRGDHCVRPGGWLSGRGEVELSIPSGHGPSFLLLLFGFGR